MCFTMTNEIILPDNDQTNNNQLAPAELVQVGEVANRYAAASVFDDYIMRKSANTIKAQLADLRTFADYMMDVAPQATFDAVRFQSDPSAWIGVTWGLIQGFIQWMLQEGFATTTVNRKLSTAKNYAKLATKAGVIDAEAFALIKTVNGYSVKEGRRIDVQRDTTRVGDKKADHVSLTYEQALMLKDCPSTPQGRRDKLLLSLLLDHGLRVGEVALLKVSDFDLEAGLFSFFRPKVDATQTNRMTPDTLSALRRYISYGDCPEAGRLLRGSLKNGELSHVGLTERGITGRVRALGEKIGVFGLSAHDCRHYWATRAAKMGTDAFALRDAGGWTSLAMPSRYVESAEIANDRVKI